MTEKVNDMLDYFTLAALEEDGEFDTLMGETLYVVDLGNVPLKLDFEWLVVFG
jgi:hypothetical protein